MHAAGRGTDDGEQVFATPLGIARQRRPAIGLDRPGGQAIAMGEFGEGRLQLVADRLGLFGQTPIFQDEAGVFFQGSHPFGRAIRRCVEDPHHRRFVTRPAHRHAPRSSPTHDHDRDRSRPIGNAMDQLIAQATDPLIGRAAGRFAGPFSCRIFGTLTPQGESTTVMEMLRFVSGFLRSFGPNSPGSSLSRDPFGGRKGGRAAGISRPSGSRYGSTCRPPRCRSIGIGFRSDSHTWEHPPS